MERNFWLLLIILILIPIRSQAVGIITHPNTNIDSLTLNQARSIFSMRTQKWPNGELIKVFVLPETDPLHKQFTKKVLQIFPYKLRRIWDRNIYSGTGDAPTIVDNEGEMVNAISTHPGSIGYANRGNNNVRIIETQ